MNLVYQQVVQETLDQLEKLLTQNQKEQKELVTQLSGPIKEPSKQQPTNSSYQHPMKMYLGRFLKPYFKDKLTGLGPPANPEAREKASRIAGCLDDKKLKIKRWESWQKTLLIHAVSREGLRRLIQPKLSKVDYLSQKLLSAEEADRQLIREQIDNLEREIDSLRQKKEEEMIGDRYEEYDWQKISNIDFEGTREAGDIRCFWQNFLHPSINKTRWSQEEVQRLKEISMRYGERNWEAVALELGTGRTAFMCLQMYQRFVSGSLKRGSWTPAEDALLRELVDKMRIGNFIPYTQMSYFMDGRDPSQLIYRWNQVLDPSLKKGPWTKQEDKLLLQAVARHGEKNWWKIRLEVPGRTDGGCRDRYYDCLKAGTKRGPFDRKERELLLELVEKHGVGHWAKIVAEIPNRTDAQCMRTWRQMVKVSDEKLGLAKKPPRRRRGDEKKNKKKLKVATANKNIRRRLKAINDEVISEGEEEEEEIEYMDSEDEKKQIKKTEGVEMETLVAVQKEGEEEESEDEYTFPVMQEWIPVEKAQPFTFLNFRPVVLVSSNEAHNDNFVRSTIVGKFGRSVIVGPHPRELQWEERHNSSAMMMVSPDQLRAHLHHQARRFKRRAQCKGKNTKTSKPLLMKGMTAQGIDLMLQAAVTPWIGNLLIPASTRTTAIDVLRERGEKKGLSSTSIFKLFLQVTNVDVIGCKEMIDQRQNGVMFLTPPADPSSVKFKNANTVAGMLQRIKLEMQKLPEVDRQTPRSRLLPLMPPQNQPRLVLQVPPNISPQVAPMPFPQAASIPHSVLQLNAASSPAQHTSPHAGVTISPLPALSTCQTLTTPPVFVVPMLQNIAPTCSQQAVPLTQSLTASLPPFLNQPISVGSTHAAVLSSAACPSQNCLSPTTLKPPRERGQMENHESQNRVVHTGVAGEVDVNKDGKETQKLSQKASASHQVTEAKAEVIKTTMSAPLKTASIQSSNFSSASPLPPHQLCSAPIQQIPQTVCSSKATSFTAPAVDVISSSSLTSLHLTPDDSSTSVNLSVPPPQSDTPSCSDRAVPSSLNHSLVPLPSSLTSPCPPDCFSSDHNYPFLTPGPTPIQHGSDLSHLCLVSKQPISSVPVGQTKEKKRQREVIEKKQVMSNKDDQCVGRTSTDVDGKRVRKLTHKAKSLQEEAQAKAEAKKRKTSASSSQQKRSRSAGGTRSASSARRARSKGKVSTQTPVVGQPPRLHLLPGQSMWVMTPTGLVQFAQAPPQGLEMAVIKSVPPSGNDLSRSPPPPHVQFPTRGLRPLAPKPSPVPIPINLLNLNQSHPLLAPPSVQSTVLDHGCYSLPFCPQLSSTSFSQRGTVKVDPPEPRPFRKVMLQIDPSLMFLEPLASVHDWLSGSGGVVVPGEGEALPYLPPFVGNLSTLSALLRAKKSLLRSSLQLLREGNKPRWPRTSSKPDSSAEAAAKNSSNEPPPQPPADLPDSTSDFTHAGKQPHTNYLTAAPSASSDHLQQQEKKEEEEEEEQVEAVRQLVAERFSSNPAYRLLKARFLSCFTVPALLATLPPVRKVETCQTNEEQEEEAVEGEEEVDLKKLKEMAKRRRAEKSKHLLCDTSGASASHFSGIMDVTGPTTDET
ncbi:snRNA-activating protein complex subunit 4 isoform X1 [Archocentrus centrarchus]|nr:snRNA-activating protein complex subunit 4-like isoform X1 [Archocentrus centrarchus]XP_030579653.1 snRNA-activating protein complex subunit 4-like isoform X1 [Archocentrus centrarchus]XP_030579654.1 snRNA-activating protein complex subunit 4-like isoform X1 [Archocentrus centrarchus]XP_030579655.1 snRNA-activating protein complex subunit 4-like isoform X1 [Archocentrus centrarchus]